MLNIIVAPKAYDPHGERYTKKIVKYLKSIEAEYSVYFSETFDSISETVKELLSFGESDFIVVGDDVVVSKFLNSIKDMNKIKLGIVPVKKQDDFALFLGLSNNPVQAIKDIMTKHIETVDLLCVNNMPVLNNVLIGASVEILSAYNQYKIKNIISEKIAAAKYGDNFGGVELSLESKNTKTRKERVFEMVIANGGFSKGKPVSPLSNVKDGLFNVNYSVVSNKQGKKKYIKLFNKGEHIYDDETRQYWLDNLKITNPDKKIKAILDGTIHNFESLEIIVLEGALKLYKKK
ncbi:MAG: hypothetical protein E7351_01045 [Clostridiales bacterium]|nr:hypothetical protein [Clostridiales bacterium]